MNKTEFLENMIHDMKIPLSIMYAKIELLESDNKLTEDSLESLKIIKNNWYRVMKFVTDISDYEKLDKGLMTINYKNENIVLIIKNIVDISKILAYEKNITFDFVSNVNTKIMAVDKDIIERILLNLISNAIKHSENYILIKLHAYKNFVSITIKDDGKGIKFDNIEVIFDRYVTSKNSTKTTSGIGLDIVKQFIDLLNGTITLKSDLSGTEIKIDLPCFQTKVQDNDISKIEDFYKTNKFVIELAYDK